MFRKSILFTFLFVLISIFITIRINQFEIRPDTFELSLLKNEFGNIKIQDSSDIIRIQNLVIKQIRHKFINSNKLVLKDILRKKSGYCYDRSFILQKILIYNNIPIRPVFIFYNLNNNKTTFIDFFNKKTLSHNVFEFKYKGKWYIMKTIHFMKNFESLDGYIISGKNVPPNSKFLRYLNNRNSRFLSPNWLPDIYYFN